MKAKRVCPFSIAVLLAFLVVLGTSAAALADGRVVQNDPNNPIKYSIDPNIANGSVSTPDQFIGTLRAYLGDKADGHTTVFQGGAAKDPNDILIMNNKVGIVLAVGTPDFWGYPGGSICDDGRITSVPPGATDLKGATFGDNTTLTTQFLFNGWDAWAPVNTGVVYFDLVKYNFQTKAVDDVNGLPAVQVTRKFLVPYNLSGVSTPRDLDVVSYYGIAPGKNYAYMFDTVHNNGVAFAASCQNEVCNSNLGGEGIDTKTIAALTAAESYNWVSDAAGNPENQFSTTLISPGQNPGSDGRNHPFASFTGAQGYREMRFADPSYVVGETRIYESYVLIDNQCSWQKVYDFWAAYQGLGTFNVSGSVTDAASNPVPYPVIMLYRGTTFDGWVMGDKNGAYSVDIPNENATQAYNLRVEKSGFVEGTPSADFTSATVPSGGIDLQTRAALVPVTFHFQDQNGNPVWGKVTVGTAPTVAFTGQNYFYTDNAADGSVAKGTVTAMVAPGSYSATCYGEGLGFYSYTTSTTSFSQVVTGDTTTNPTQTVTIQKPLSAPTDWFGIDNHHHGTRADAFSPPELTAKSELLGGLEVLGLNDHNYVLDNSKMHDWALKMGASGYVPSEEVTASWAHFNALPLTKSAYTSFLDRKQQNRFVNYTGTLQQILDDGHNLGISIGPMHPDSGYGLFQADDNHTVPGGMTDDFNGIEDGPSLNGAPLNEAISCWNAYLTGGSFRGNIVTKPHYIWASTDIHNVMTSTTSTSGAKRSYVYVNNGAAKSQADFDAFSLEVSKSEAAGHSYVSSGVFITPTSGKIYGNTYAADANGTFTGIFKVSSLNNISTIYVFGSTGTGTGTGSFTAKNVVSQTTYTGSDLSPSKNFTLTVNNVQGRQWYAIAAVNSNNKLAFTNPIWVNGPDVGGSKTITGVHPLGPLTVPPAAIPVAGIPTAIVTTTPWSDFLLADWKLVNANAYALTFAAPDGYAFDASLSDPSKGIKVSPDGASYTTTVEIPATPPTVSASGVTDGAWLRRGVTITLTAWDEAGGSGVATISYTLDGVARTMYGASNGASVQVDLPASPNSTHTLTYGATDVAGNASLAKTLIVHIDTTSPAGTFTLAGGAATTTTTAVAATSAVTEANGPVQMRFSLDGKASWSSWEAYAASKALTLPGSLGAKTVYAQYRDAAGNVLELSDAITLVAPPDTTAPTVESSGASQGAWYRVARLVTLTASDSGSGVASITYTLHGIETTVPGALARVSVPASPNGLHALTYYATDASTNSCASKTLTFMTDTRGPVPTGKATSGRKGRAITLRYKISDGLSPKATAIRIVVKNAKGKITKSLSLGTKNTATWYSVKWTPKAKGTYRYYVYAKDLAGNAQRIKGNAKVVVR